MIGIICPLCRERLERAPKTWVCARGHSFDVAKQGYVNLLPVQQKNSRAPGDSAEMVLARRQFLQAGLYSALRDAIVELLKPMRAQGLLDIGCGEGYYTSAMTQVAVEVMGLDIAKRAVQLAATRFRDVTWLVGSAALLPVADAAVDIVISLFTPLQILEMHRVLRPGGTVLLVTPAPEHLWSLRAGLFDDVRAHYPDKFLKDFEARFELYDRREVRMPLRLTQIALKQLLSMTPYAWKAKPEKREALEASDSFATEAAFSLMMFQKKSSFDGGSSQVLP